MENEQSYNVPVIKRPANATLCFSGNFNFHTSTIGRSNMAKSVTMVSEPCVRRILGRSIHLPPTMVISQFLAIGWQLKMNSKDPRTEYTIVAIMTTHTTILNGWCGEIRR